MDEGSKKPNTTNAVVEDIRDKTDRALSLLWYKWKSSSTEDVLHRSIGTCIQMDKQAESEEELHLCSILQIQATQSIARTEDISPNIYPVKV